MRISALAQISCDVRYRRLQDKSPKIQGKTALWSWARSLTARTTLSATTLRPANMATLSSRVLSIRPRSCEPRCRMHPQWQGFLSPPRLWWRRNRSQRLLPCLQAVWAAWATWTINRFTQATAKFGRPPALVALLLMMRLGEAACGTYQHNRWPHGPGLCMYIAALNGIAGRGPARSVAGRL